MILLALTTCSVVLVTDVDSTFSDRVHSELASSLPCADVSRSFEPDGRPTIVRIVSRRTVEVWENGALAHVLALDGHDDIDAVKVAEHVHARDVARSRPPRWSGDASEDRATTATALPTARPRFALSAGIGPVVEAGALGLGARVALRARIAGPLGAGVMLVAPLAAATLSGPEGEAEVSTLSVGPTLDVELRVPESPFSGSLGVGGLFSYTRATGVAASPLQGRRVSAERFVPAFVASAAFALTSRVAIELTGAVGVSVSSLEIRFAGNEIARWGAPYAIATAGAVIAF